MKRLYLRVREGPHSRLSHDGGEAPTLLGRPKEGFSVGQEVASGSEPHQNWLTDGLADWLIGCLSDWLTDRLTDWVTDWLAIWLIDWLSGWLTDWLSDWMTVWVTDWLGDWLADCQSDWLTDCLAGWLAGCLTDWLASWLPVWLTGWLTGWLTDRPTDRTTDRPTVGLQLTVSWPYFSFALLPWRSDFWGCSQNYEKSTVSIAMSVFSHGPARLLMNGFLWNSIFEYFPKICQNTSSFIKIWQE